MSGTAINSYNIATFVEKMLQIISYIELLCVFLACSPAVGAMQAQLR